MAAPAKSGGYSSAPSLSVPCPKSPPDYPDLYGKRRELAKVQMLERDIGFLEEELKSVPGFQAASRCCQEVTDFVVANSDPLIPTNRKNRKSCRFWKWLCEIPFFNLSWICCCCYSACFLSLEIPRCCDCKSSSCSRCEVSRCCGCKPCSHSSCFSCSAPKCRCSWGCPRPRSHCCRNFSCSSSSCSSILPSCPDCSCCRWTCSCPVCPKQCLSTKTCCNPCCLLF